MRRHLIGDRRGDDPRLEAHTQRDKPARYGRRRSASPQIVGDWRRDDPRKREAHVQLGTLDRRGRRCTASRYRVDEWCGVDLRTAELRGRMAAAPDDEGAS